MNKTNAMMNEKEMDMVVGGGWGYNTYHNEDEYHAAGVTTDWTGWYNPFQRDKFFFNGNEIKADTAAKIVFFVRHANPVPGSFTIKDVLNYAVNNQDAFKSDIKKANG